MLPREDAPETCAETIHLTAGGEAGRHLSAIVTPLIVHDLPVTVWWPGEPPFTSRAAYDLLSGADRLVVDGSTWNGDGLERMREMAGLLDVTRLAISDFALIRQSRWREAIASIFDDPDFLPYLGSLRRIAVTYATHDETGAPGSTNIVKPIYHVAWLASRLGMSVVKPLAVVAERPGGLPLETRARRTAGGQPRDGGHAEPGARRGRGRRCGRSSRRCPPARPSASSCSPSGAAPSCAPTSPRKPKRSTCGSGRTGWRHSNGGSSPRGAVRSTCWPRRSRPAAARTSPPVSLRAAAQLVGGPIPPAGARPKA